MSHLTAKPILPEAFFLLKPPLLAGAAATFFGMVREDRHGNKHVVKLEYHSYASMADRRIRAIREEAMARWGLIDARILHRVGTLLPGETAIAVAAISGHRAEAFAACEEIVEHMKHTVPIWKKECFSDGTFEWAVCRHAGHEAALS